MNIQNVSVLLVACVSLAVAGDQSTAGDLGKGPAKLVTVKAKSEITSLAITSTTMREVIASEVTIAANGNAIFQSTLDFSGADKVGMAVTTLSDSNSTMTKVRFGVAWAAPGDWYVLTDMVLGSGFYFIDHGGATVPVYGPFLKVIVFNDGTTPVRITQLSVNTVAR